MRPLSSSTRWNSRGPSPGVTPVQNEVYGFIRSAVEDAAAAGGRPRDRPGGAATFSMPITEIRTSGRVGHIRPLPSDSTTQIVPVSATAKLAPLIGRRARQELVAQVGPRAAPARSPARRSGPADPASAAEELADLGAVLVDRRHQDMAGRSSASCTISSARSVSSGVDSGRLQRRVEPDLVGGQRLDLDHLLGAGRRRSGRRRCVGLGGVGGPVHHAARRGDRSLRAEEVASRSPA